MLFFLFVILSFVRADPPSDLNNFNWTENSGYAITGGIRIIAEFGLFRISDVSGSCVIVVHKDYGIFFDLGPGGKFVVSVNGSTYNWNNQQFGNGTGCATVTGFGYLQEVDGYHFATSDDLFSDGVNIVYSGLVYDSNGCGRPIFVTIRTHNNVIVWFKFIQAYNFGPGVCAMITGVMDMAYSSRTYNTTTIAGYFSTIPAVCFGNSTIDFCPAAYGTNNACDNLITPFPSHKKRSFDI